MEWTESFEDVLFDPFAKQRTLAQVVRNNEPLTAIPTQGPKMPPPPRAATPQSPDDPTNPNATPPWLTAGYQSHQQASALPQATQAASPAPARPDLRQQSLDRATQAMEAATTMPDMSQQVERYRRGYEAAGPDMAFAAFMSEMGGEMGQQMGGQILKHALARRAPMTTDYGTIDYAGGFTADPMKERAFQVARLEKQAQLLEAAAQHAETVEQRREAARRAEELRREIAAQSNATRMAIADSRPRQEPLVQVQLDDGSIQYMPRSQAVGMRPAPKSGSGNTSESERSSAGYLHRMREAEKILSSEELRGAQKPGLVEHGLRSFGGKTLANVMSPQGRQLVYQAQADWVRAKLRKESGAVIGEDEMAEEIRTYFPQIGDTPAMIAQKAQARKAAEEQMRIGAGRASAASEPAAPDAPPPGAVREVRR